MEKNTVFQSTIWRFGPWVFPQLIQINDGGIEFTKLKVKNFIGVPIDVTSIGREFINGVYINSHLLFGSKITIENISGSNIVLKNFKRSDAEIIYNLIMN
jgi:hypothetical protein